MNQGPGPHVPPGTVVHHRTIIAKPAGAPAAVVVVAAPPPPPPVVVVATPVPHEVRVVHRQGHVHTPGLPKLVGIKKAEHRHHARVMHVGHQHAAPIVPGHAAHRAAQPTLRATLVHQVPVGSVVHGAPVAHPVPVTQAGHPAQVVPSATTRIVHKK